MSIATDTAKVQYTLSTAAQALPIPFYFLENAHIQAYKGGETPVLLVLGTDYTLVGAGDEDGGTLTTIADTAADLGAADVITIRRSIPITQQTNYVYNDKFPAEVHERALDKLTMVAQELKETVDRAIVFHETEVGGAGNKLPTAPNRAGKILGFTANGQALELLDPVSAVFAEGDLIQCNSVTALKAVSVTPLTNGYQAFVAGYASAGDGGGGQFVYVLASSETEDIGTIVAPNAGVGRWRRVYSDLLNVKWFGATGDGATNDSAAVLAASDAAIRIGVTLFFPPGTYKIGTSISITGSVKWLGSGKDTIIDGTGNPFQGGANLGFGVTINGGVEAVARTATGVALYNGSTQIPINSVTGLAVGDEVYCELGVDPTDATQPFIRMFAKITNITTLTITLDNGVAEDVNGTSHKVWKVTNPCKNLSITQLAINNCPFSINYVQNGVVSDIFMERAVGGFLITNVFNLTFERIVANLVQSVGTIGIASSYGWFIQGWGHYGVRIRDIHIRNLQGVCFFSSESQSRDTFMDNIRLACSTGLAPSGYSVIRGDSTTRPMVVRNIYVTHLDDNTTRSYGGQDQNILYENFYFEGNSPEAAAFAAMSPLNLQAAGVSGILRVNRKVYNKRVPFRFIIRPPTGVNNTNFTMPTKGILGRSRIYVSSLTGITYFRHYNNSGTEDVLAQLVAGQFIDLSDFQGSVNPATPNIFTEQRTWRIHLDGTQPVTACYIIEGELLQSSTSIQLVPEFKIVSAAPSANADFVGQEAYDETAGKLYRAINVGAGAADWIALN